MLAAQLFVLFPHPNQNAARLLALACPVEILPHTVDLVVVWRAWEARRFGEEGLEVRVDRWIGEENVPGLLLGLSSERSGGLTPSGFTASTPGISLDSDSMTAEPFAFDERPVAASFPRCTGRSNAQKVTRGNPW